MIVAIDYDDTYTLAPLTWSRVIRVLEEAGHLVVCVTSRLDPATTNEYPDDYPNLGPIDDIPCEVFYTNLKAKKPFMAALDYHIDVWIDDNPGAVLVDWPGLEAS